jgi:hypothetical protein
MPLNRIQRQAALVKTVMNFEIPKEVEDFLLASQENSVLWS